MNLKAVKKVYRLIKFVVSFRVSVIIVRVKKISYK